MEPEKERHQGCWNESAEQPVGDEEDEQGVQDMQREIRAMEDARIVRPAPERVVHHE